jgi:hypothetical protein
VEPSGACPTSTPSTILGIGMRGGGLGFFIPDKLGRKSLRDSSSLDPTSFPHVPKTIFFQGNTFIHRVRLMSLTQISLLSLLSLTTSWLGSLNCLVSVF